MRDLVDINGSWLSGAEISSHLWSLLTPDARFLLAVTQSDDSLFRAHVYHRVSYLPQWKGTYWADVDHPSLTDTFESAQALTHEWVRTLLENDAA
jgi:hypothetical protein